MPPPPRDAAALLRDNAELQARLQEAEETLQALRGGEIDAIIVGDDIYTLEGAEWAANRFRSDVLAQMGDAVVVLDAGCRVVYLNPAAERQYGMSASHALGRPLAQFYTEEWLEHGGQASAMQQLQQQGFWRGRNRHRRSDGGALLVEITQSLLRDGHGAVIGSLVVARDVSAKAAADVALEESRARRAFTLESARIGDWELDLRSGSVRRSLRHDLCFGYGAAVAHWTVEILLQHVHADHRTAVRQAFADAIAGHGDMHFECRVHWPDGHEHWIEMHGTLLIAAEQPQRLVGIVSDITARKQAETAMREADSRKDVFLATLAHELRNPLAPMRNAVRILQISNEPQQQARALAILESQLEQMVRLLDDLMDVSRISRGQMELRRQRVAIATVLQNAVDSTRPLIEQKRHELVLQWPESPVLLDADVTRLTQVVVNLLNNAAKYTPEGGCITLSARHDAGTLVIAVQDTGIGIRPEMLPHVFEMFTQARRRGGTTTSTTEGMGIGLALVKRLVEMHGGSVAARSAGEGLGATVEVRLPVPLPLPAPAAQATASDAAATSTPGRSCRVLVAEDNPDSASSMAMLLQLLGHESLVARDGLQAVASAEDFRPHVVLMDIGLPGCDGYEAARRIRAAPWGREMLLVALTGWGQEADRDRSQRAGLDHHLVKPVDPVLLEQLLQQAART